MLGATLTKDEVEEFMNEADVVSMEHKMSPSELLILLIAGWEW